MPNRQTQWRIELAQFLFEKVKTEQGIQVCFIGGSVGKGQADEYSDLKICFVWDESFNDQTRLLVNEKMGVENFYLNY